MRGSLPPPDANRWLNWCGGCEACFLIGTLPRQRLPLAGHKRFADLSMAPLHSLTTNAQRWPKLIRKIHSPPGVSDLRNGCGADETQHLTPARVMQ